MPIYLNYDNIPGDVTSQGHEQWVECNSFQWGVGRGMGSPTGTQKDRESSTPSISEIVITKPYDAATSKLFHESVAGTLDKTVKLEFTTTTANQTTTYLYYELTNTGISGWSQSSGGDSPMESISLNFTKVMMKVVPMDPDVQGTPDAVTYDLSTQTTS